MIKDKKNLTIIRSAVGCLASTGFLKFLKQEGFRLVGTDITDMSVGRLFVDKFYKVPKAEDEEKVINRYVDIVKKENPAWIISGPEEEILILAKARKTFASLGVELLHPPVQTLEVVIDKLKVCEFFSDKAEINTPATCTFSDFTNGSLKKKFILKPKKGRGSRDTFIVRGEELLSLKKTLNSNDYIVQDFIEGEEFTVDALYDLEANLLNIIPRKRIKTDSGISVIGETQKDKNLYELVLKISGYLKFIGGNCFQFIKNLEGDYFLIDINPRLGGGFCLSLAASKTLGENFVNLLKGQNSLLTKLSFDFQEMRMYRAYQEVYET